MKQRKYFCQKNKKQNELRELEEKSRQSGYLYYDHLVKTE